MCTLHIVEYQDTHKTKELRSNIFYISIYGGDADDNAIFFGFYLLSLSLYNNG